MSAGANELGVGTKDLPTPTDPREWAAAALTRRREVLTALLARGPESLTAPDFVHDVRVAARRLGEAVRLLKAGSMDSASARAVEASLRSLRRSMGPLRDADITCEHLLRWRMPAPLKRLARELAAELKDRRPEFAEAARRQLGSASLARAMVILAHACENMARPETSPETRHVLVEAVERQLRRRQRQIRAAFGRAARKQTAASLHEARIAVKKLRYALELADDTGIRRGSRGQIRYLRQVQQLLGAHHDTQVIIDALADRLNRQSRQHRGGPARRTLSVAWRAWRRKAHRLQALRAGEFFSRSYAWMNR